MKRSLVWLAYLLAACSHPDHEPVQGAVKTVDWCRVAMFPNRLR